MTKDLLAVLTVELSLLDTNSYQQTNKLTKTLHISQLGVWLSFTIRMIPSQKGLKMLSHNCGLFAIILYVCLQNMRSLFDPGPRQFLCSLYGLLFWFHYLLLPALFIVDMFLCSFCVKLTCYHIAFIYTRKKK